MQILAFEDTRISQVLGMWNVLINCCGYCLSLGIGNFVLSSEFVGSQNKREIEQSHTSHQTGGGIRISPPFTWGPVVAVRLMCLLPPTSLQTGSPQGGEAMGTAHNPVRCWAWVPETVVST